ncbi:MAG TPA: response regulator [Anaeromyxobacteraceae bacterium]|nr:response regulator [Anaeromyxobacteraceae bacterium]
MRALPSGGGPAPVCAQWRVLLVEDDDDLREITAECLALEGFLVDAACDGVAALEQLERDPLPDVLILDLVMPRMGGLELMERLLASPRLAPLPVVVVTGTPPSARPRVEAMLQKPVDFGQLCRVLLRVLERPPGAID